MLRAAGLLQGAVLHFVSHRLLPMTIGIAAFRIPARPRAIPALTIPDFYRHLFCNLVLLKN